MSTPTATPTLDLDEARKGRWALRRRRLPRAWRRPLAVIGMVVIAFWVLVALFAPLLAPSDPLAQSFPRFLPPSPEHLFGTDGVGRDVLSRVIYGAQISLPVAVLLVILSVIIGGTIGALAGFFGGIVDTVLMRIVDLFFAFPAIILAMAVSAALGPSLTNAVLAIVVVSWPAYARVTRSLVLTLRDSNYIAASRLLGVSSTRALLREVLPNVGGPILVLATLELGNAVLLLSGLSFLGLGAVPPTPEWGAMVSEGARVFYNYWVALFPGIAIFSIVIAFNFLGDALRDALDPRVSRAVAASEL
ncbi:ABC transporter permease [Herbiconiux sp. L3-i23]|uniref:ABC transporter permease n=1 Tax=Herbiconiux sp. L3-i23 TaxID=2905871 RepID=UPI0020560EBD|nr:ABC transporter permease [Herbiconiux sp. L3-i23]BDI21865.1 cytochrome c550 [Herbiconiux sp. L3-i23]